MTVCHRRVSHCGNIQPVISVVIAVRNGLPWLEDQLSAVAAQECASEWEALVCDNGSTDSSAEVAYAWAERSERFRFVDASSRPGPAAARNTGVRCARGDLLAFCDADDVVQPGWLEAMRLALADADVVAGSFEMKSLNGGPESVPQPAVTSQLGQLPAGLAANLGVRQVAFEAVGGFAEELKTGEDIDLCWRMQIAGSVFATEPRAVVAKRERESGRALFKHGFVHGRGSVELYRRHRSAGIHPDFHQSIRAWGWIVLEVPRIYRKDLRRRWLRAVGVRLGRLVGSAEKLVFFP
jgi:glycosyltransferase involved in cell wall biosynthesis